jgi:glycosyltransferase involved in cell wall biosynthesis
MVNKSDTIKICYLSGRESSYARTRVILKGMKEAGIEVIDCSFPKRNLLRHISGFYKFLRYRNECDLVFVGFYGQFLVPLVKLFTRKPILFDAFLSTYQTLAIDRQSINPFGALARLARFIDRLSCRLADVVFLDTNAHIDYFVKEFKLNRNKFHRLFAGSDDSVMYPRPKRDEEEFIVHFHGDYQRLHGLEYIIEAAAILPEVKFQIIGNNKTLKICLEKSNKTGVNNITLIPSVVYEKLTEYMGKASICLGIFGDTQKAKMVIPHKAYEALAMAKPLITADTPAARDLLTNGEDAVLCKATPNSIAESIIKLKIDPALREKIAQNGHKVFKERCTLLAVGNQIKTAAQGVLQKH